MAEAGKTRPGVQIAVDYAGLVLFAAAFWITRDLQKAAVGLIVGSLAGLILGYVAHRKIAPMPAITGATAIVFGGASLLFHDTAILKMKLTIVDGALAAALLIGLAMKKQPLKSLLGEAIKMSDAGWRRLTINYALFFLVSAVVNEIVWRNTSDATWALFKFPGMPIAALLFSLAHAPMMMKEHAAMEGVLPPPAD